VNANGHAQSEIHEERRPRSFIASEDFPALKPLSFPKADHEPAGVAFVVGDEHGDTRSIAEFAV